MKSQRAEKQGPRKQAPRQSREVGRPQADQPRRPVRGRAGEEEQGFGDDEEESDR
jgi:hypothetical protein